MGEEEATGWSEEGEGEVAGEGDGGDTGGESDGGEAGVLFIVIP